MIADRFTLAVGLLALVTPAASLEAQTRLGPCTFWPSSSSAIVLGHAVMHGVEAEAGDIISAWDDRGHCAGAAEVVIDAGLSHINLPVYGDDPVTDLIDEGMGVDERFFLRLLDISSGDEWMFNGLLSGWSNQGGAPVPSLSDESLVVNFSKPVPRLSLKVLLEGPYDPSATLMSTGLVDAGVFPAQQPYAADPWRFGGSESVEGPPSGAVDWILVRLATGDPTTPPIATYASMALILLADGSVIDPAGPSVVRLAALPGDYYVIVEHRNHLAAMTASPVTFGDSPVAVDLTGSESEVYGGSSGVGVAADGTVVLLAGDADANGQVQSSDNVFHWAPFAGTAGYRASDGSSPDFDLNGQVQNVDRNLLWAINSGKDSQVPVLHRDAVFTNSVGIRFVRIPSGTFQMGSDADVAVSWEQPVHEVTLTHDFQLGMHEVTQSQWEAVMGSNPSYFSQTGAGAPCGPDCPVEMVSWLGAIGYTRLLSVAEGLAPCYDGSGNVIGGGGGNVYLCEGYRLPTEAEWEYATRAGTTTEYSFGEDYPPTGLRRYAWYDVNSSSTTRPVGGRLPNPWGLYDVHGNVWEWAHDGYSSSYYEVTPGTDPQGPATAEKVLRGGSWDIPQQALRSAFRYNSVYVNSGNSGGFRVARTIP